MMLDRIGSFCVPFQCSSPIDKGEGLSQTICHTKIAQMTTGLKLLKVWNNIRDHGRLYLFHEQNTNLTALFETREQAFFIPQKKDGFEFIKLPQEWKKAINILPDWPQKLAE